MLVLLLWHVVLSTHFFALIYLRLNTSSILLPNSLFIHKIILLLFFYDYITSIKNANVTSVKQLNKLLYNTTTLFAIASNIVKNKH